MDERCVVTAMWDAAAAVWVAESDDVPGLVAESPTLEALWGKPQTLVPELLAENAGLRGVARVAIELRVRLQDGP